MPIIDVSKEELEYLLQLRARQQSNGNTNVGIPVQIPKEELDDSMIKKFEKIKELFPEQVYKDITFWEYQKNTLVDMSDSMYYILSGSVMISDKNDSVIAITGEGHLIGTQKIAIYIGNPDAVYMPHVSIKIYDTPAIMMRINFDKKIKNLMLQDVQCLHTIISDLNEIILSNNLRTRLLGQSNNKKIMLCAYILVYLAKQKNQNGVSEEDAVFIPNAKRIADLFNWKYASEIRRILSGLCNDGLLLELPTREANSICYKIVDVRRLKDMLSLNDNDIALLARVIIP